MPEIHLPMPAMRSGSQWVRLVVLTSCVVAGHGVLLMGTPHFTLSVPRTGYSDHAFTIRRLDAYPPLVPAALMPKIAASRPKMGKPTGAVARPNSMQTPEPTSVEVAATAVEPPTAAAAADTPVSAPEAAASQGLGKATATTTAAASARTKQAAMPEFAIPASTRIHYDVRGIVGGTSYTGGGELLWQHDGKSYEARLAIRKFFFTLRVQTSKGQLSTEGLQPTRFGDKRSSELAAHFERSASKIIFSANNPDAPLQPGAQDQLSVFIQLAAMLGGQPERYAAGSSIMFQTVGAHYAEQWTFAVGSSEKLNLPGGELTGVKLTRDPVGEHDSKVEAWLASDVGYLPVHIRLSQANGDFVDMLCSSIEKP